MDFIAPKALNGKITAITPNVDMTLDVTAKAAANNANVYHDNTPKAVHIERTAWTYGDNVRCLLSGLDHAISRQVRFISRHGWTFEGASGPINGPTTDGLITPWGSPCEFTFFFQCETVGGRAPGVKNMRQIGNHAAIGYGADWKILNSLGTPLPKGNVFVASHNVIAQNLYVDDVFSEAVSYTACYQENSAPGTPYGVKNVYLRKRFQEQHYMGWGIVSANSGENPGGRGISFDDCEIDRDWYGSAFETFQEPGAVFRTVALGMELGPSTLAATSKSLTRIGFSTKTSWGTTSLLTRQH